MCQSNVILADAVFIDVTEQKMDPKLISDFTQKDLLDTYFDANKEAVDFVQKEIISVLNGQINLSLKEEAIVGTFFRMHALASSLTRLNNKLDFNAIAVIARTLFEVLIDLKLLTNASDEGMARFRAFPKVDRFKKAKALLEFQGANPGVERQSFFDPKVRKDFVEAPGKQDEIENDVKALWGITSKGEPSWPGHWSHLNFKDRVKSFGAAYEQEYLEIYSLLSWYVHAGTAGYAGFSEQGLEAVYGISLKLSRRMYIEGLIICATIFHLSKAIEKFSQVMDFLENAPKQFLIDLGIKKAAHLRRSTVDLAAY